MSIGSSCNNCSPEAPDITINETIITVNGTTTVWQSEAFAIGNSTGGLGLAFTLAATPQAAKSVMVFLNGVVLRYTTDYTLATTTLTLAEAIVAGDVLAVRYWSYVP